MIVALPGLFSCFFFFFFFFADNIEEDQNRLATLFSSQESQTIIFKYSIQCLDIWTSYLILLMITRVMQKVLSLIDFFSFIPGIF